MGGYFLEDWTVDRNDLESAENIKFKVFIKSSIPADTAEFAKYWKETVLEKSKDNLPLIR